MKKQLHGPNTKPTYQSPSATQTAAKPILTFLVVASLATGSIVLNRAHEAAIIQPKFEMFDFEDQSLSFKQTQFKEVLPAHDAIYSACFHGEAVQYLGYGFGANVVEKGEAVTSSAKETWPILFDEVAVVPTASRFAPTFDLVEGEAAKHPNRKFVVVYQTDGESTDWDAMEVAARRLAKCPNVVAIIFSGVIPSCRSRLKKTLEPFGRRFVAFDSIDQNAATMEVISSLVDQAKVSQ